MEKEIRNSNPLVSVVVCTYNGEKYIALQLDTVLQQTYANLEIIIVDDASTDNTKNILEQYRAKDNRIKLFFNDTNLGYNKNFEKGIGFAAADYIAISDQDDIWELNKIEIMINNWPHGALFVYSLSGDFWGNDFENRMPAPKVFYSDINDTHKLVFNSPVHGHACMFKKELMKQCVPFPADIFYDWWMSMHAASMGTIGCIPQTLTWHRVHDKNSSRALTSIINITDRNQQLRKQSILFLETFFSRSVAKEDEKKSLLHYAELLKQTDDKKFCWPMFWYVMKRRKQIFHYKKKPFVFFSHLKHARKMAYKGLL